MRTSVSSAAALLLIAAVASAEPAMRVNDGYPEWSPDGGRIVFESTRDGNAEIYTMANDGTDVRRLTSSPAYDRIPSFSPDGRHVIFQSTRHSDPFHGPLTYQLYVMDVDGENVRRLTDSGASDIAGRFSPDGTRIAFASDREGSFEVFVMNADGTDARSVTSDVTPAGRLASGQERGNPHWTADGSGILFDTHDTATGKWEIFRLDLATGRAENVSVTHVPDGQGAFFGSASPDGRTIAMSFHHVSGASGDWEIWTRDLSTGTFQRLTTSPGNDFWQAFSPDGRSLAFASNLDGTYAIYRVPVSGGAPLRLTRR